MRSAIFLTALFPFPLFSQGFQGPACINCRGLGGPGTWIFWIIIAIILGIIAFKLLSKKSEPSDPLSILKKRYASGEITREEFERMKKDL